MKSPILLPPPSWGLLLLLSLSVACNTVSPVGYDDDDDDDDNDSSSDDDDATSDDDATGDDDDSVPTDDDLPGDCVPEEGNGDSVLLRGTVVVPDPVYSDGYVLFSRSTGLIQCVGLDCADRAEAQDASVVCAEGLILPGLIDPHNHMQYNTLPRWQHQGLFEDRYEWQGDSDYDEFKKAYDDIADYRCQSMKWAETRQLIGGVTAVIGNSGDCVGSLVRNLDEGEDATGIPGYSADFDSGKIDNVSSADAEDIAADLESGALDAWLGHVSEGIDGSVRAEFDTLTDLGLLLPGVGVIHGTDLDTPALTAMAGAGMTLIWSPMSNLDLYGKTTQVSVARGLGLPVALGPDWTPSGTLNVRNELACAAHYNENFLGNAFSEKDLVDMATVNAARAVGLDGLTGQLQEGYLADITVVSGDSSQPYHATITSQAEDVRLVVVAGQALYGDPSLVEGWEGTPYCETLDVCGEERRICVQRDDSGDYGESLEDIEGTLISALMDAASSNGVSEGDDFWYAYQLSPLFECGAPQDFAACAPAQESTEDDPDADEVESSDNCPSAWNPDQGDADSDGLGDACDPCVLDPDIDCDEPPAADLDGDGFPDDEDNCPEDSNPDQEDADSDGKGDACDDCPEEPNPGTEGCAYTIPQIRNPDHPDHPADGTAVEVTGAVVIALVSDGNGHGFWIRDPDVEEWGAIQVFTYDVLDVVPGDVVTVSGTYIEYYGNSELVDPSWIITDSMSLPDPIPVDAEEVATLGSRAEALESQVVEVDGPLTVTDANPDAPDDYDEFAVSGDLRVDDYAWNFPYDPEGGETVTTLRGVLIYAFSNFKVAPLGEEDLVIP